MWPAIPLFRFTAVGRESHAGPRPGGRGGAGGNVVSLDSLAPNRVGRGPGDDVGVEIWESHKLNIEQGKVRDTQSGRTPRATHPVRRKKT